MYNQFYQIFVVRNRENLRVIFGQSHQSCTVTGPSSCFVQSVSARLCLDASWIQEEQKQTNKQTKEKKNKTNKQYLKIYIYIKKILNNIKN